MGDDRSGLDRKAEEWKCKERLLRYGEDWSGKDRTCEDGW